MFYQIPLDATPDQEIQVTVDVDEENIPLILHIRFNTEGDFWHMDVSDGKTGDMLISNVPFVTGERLAADMLKQFSHFGIGSAKIVAVTDSTDENIPGILDLGSDFVLLWGTEAVG